LAADLTAGVARGAGRKTLPLLPPPKDETAAGEQRPYTHPHYWAAFILIGDPD
jgi:CHAT domain-containing protein